MKKSTTVTLATIGSIAFLSVIVVFCCFMIESCWGYNKLMYEHLGNSANYKTYTMTLKDIVAFKDGKSVSYSDDETIQEQQVVFVLTAHDYSDVKDFLGARHDPDMSLNDYPISLTVISSSNNILADNGFYDDPPVGKDIVVRASSWIYMDNNFFYIAQLRVANPNRYIFTGKSRSIRAKRRLPYCLKYDALRFARLSSQFAP